MKWAMSLGQGGRPARRVSRPAEHLRTTTDEATLGDSREVSGGDAQHGGRDAHPTRNLGRPSVTYFGRWDQALRATDVRRLEARRSMTRHFGIRVSAPWL